MRDALEYADVRNIGISACFGRVACGCDVRAPACVRWSSLRAALVSAIRERAVIYRTECSVSMQHVTDRCEHSFVKIGNFLFGLRITLTKSKCL